MKKRSLFTIVLALILVALVWTNKDVFKFNSTALAIGDLMVDWGAGVNEGDPLFTIGNMAPGEMEDRDVEITNNAPSSRPLAIKGVEGTSSGNLKDVLEIRISDGGGDLYGGTTGIKTLTQFFIDSLNPDGISLLTLASSEVKTLNIEVKFQETAGNEYQGTSISFDIIFGVAFEIPEECTVDLGNKFPIFGTSGSDTIHGTLKDDVIIGFEGDDKIFGKGGNDCLIGNEGKDELRGETGNDFIDGGDDDDLLIGANGKDLIFGGSGADNIRGENSEDTIHGGEGSDVITGGNSADLIFGDGGADTISSENGDDEVKGGEGDDQIDAGSGKDTVDGEGDNDSILGKAGNDNLVGGSGLDSINGHSGTDTCDGEIETNCEI